MDMHDLHAPGALVVYSMIHSELGVCSLLGVFLQLTGEPLGL